MSCNPRCFFRTKPAGCETFEIAYKWNLKYETLEILRTGTLYGRLIYQIRVVCHCGLSF